MTTVFRHIGLALLGFCLACFTLGLLFERPSETTRTLNYLRDHGDEYDVVFVGPSYVQSQIVTRVFDEELARLGIPMRSFNFGLPAMGGAEQFEITRRIVDLELPKLQWVISDVTLGPGMRLHEGNRFKARTIEWHTGRAMLRILSLPPEWRRPRRVPKHALHALARAVNLGLGVTLASEARPFRTATLRAAPDYWSDPTHPRQHGRRGLSAETHRNVLAAIDACRRKARPDREPIRVHELLELFAGTGLRGGFILSPVSRRCETLAEVDPEGRPILVFPFNDPERHPEFYRAENRMNENHLNRRGSELYSRALARRFAAHLERLEAGARERRP